MSELFVDDWEGDFESGGDYLSMDDLGKYHFFIQDVFDAQEERQTVERDDNSTYNKADAVKLSLQVLAPKEKEGKMHTFYLSRTGGFAKRTARVAKMLGLLTKEMVDEARAEGKRSVIIDWASCEGMTFCATLEKDEWKDKDGEVKVNPRIRWEFCKASEGKERGYEVHSAYDDDDPFLGQPATPAESKAGF